MRRLSLTASLFWRVSAITLSYTTSVILIGAALANWAATRCHEMSLKTFGEAHGLQP